jgi:hypothetical protein
VNPVDGVTRSAGLQSEDTPWPGWAIFRGSTAASNVRSSIQPVSSASASPKKDADFKTDKKDYVK